MEKTFKDEASKDLEVITETVKAAPEQPDFEKPRPRSRPSDKAPPKRGNSSSSNTAARQAPQSTVDGKKATKLEETQAATVASPMVIDQDDDDEDEPYELDYDLCEANESDKAEDKKEPNAETTQAPTAPHKPFVLDRDDDAKEKTNGDGADDEYSDDDVNGDPAPT